MIVRLQVWDNVDGRQVVRIIDEEGRTQFEGLVTGWSKWNDSPSIERASVNMIRENM